MGFIVIPMKFMCFLEKMPNYMLWKGIKKTTDFIRSHISMDKFVMVSGKFKFYKTKVYLSVINCEAPLDC